MYRKLRGMNTDVNHVILVHGMKIFGKLQGKREVEVMWEEVIANGWINEIVATARIDAASEMGDMEAAATIIDLLQNASMQVDAVHYSSAINACKNSESNRSHDAAMCLLGEMLARGLRPNVVTLTSVAAVHRHAPLKKNTQLMSTMSDLQVRQNRLFTETLLGAVFEGRLRNAWNVDDVAKRVAGTGCQRMRFAQSFLEDAKSQGVKFTSLTSRAEEYLSRDMSWEELPAAT